MGLRSIASLESVRSDEIFRKVDPLSLKYLIEVPERQGIFFALKVSGLVRHSIWEHFNFSPNFYMFKKRYRQNDQIPPTPEVDIYQLKAKKRQGPKKGDL